VKTELLQQLRLGGTGDGGSADNPPVFLNSKTKVKTSRPGKGGRRWYKDVGLGFRTPKTAIEGQYIGTLYRIAIPPEHEDEIATRQWHRAMGRILGGTIVNGDFLQTRSALSPARSRSVAVS
jgi:hypothetical protein